MNNSVHSFVKFSALFCSAALLTSCASQAVLHIQSEPKGAYITDDAGNLLGIAPVDIAYPVDTKSKTCTDTGGFSAKWVSGVETFIAPIDLCQTGYSSTLIRRDMSKPGLDQDLEFAVEAEMLELQRDETQAAQDAAAADWATAAAMQDAAWSMRMGRYYRGYPYYAPYYGSYYGPYYRPYYGDNYRGNDRRDYRDERYDERVEGERGEVIRSNEPAEQSSEPAATPEANQ